MITSKMKVAAGVVCITYILVQSFQWWVFSQAPSPTPSVAQELLFGAEPISVARSWLMLFSMFGLFYIFFVICASAFETHKAAGLIAFVSFFVFCLLEIMLRSVELFYIQGQLPAGYAGTTDPVRRELLLSYYTQFQRVQGALYFPLGLSQTIGSFIIAAVYPAVPRLNYALKIILLINGMRLLLRMLTVYAGLNVFPGELYDTLYLPLVYITFGVLAGWFFKRAAIPETLSYV